MSSPQSIISPDYFQRSDSTFTALLSAKWYEVLDYNNFSLTLMMGSTTILYQTVNNNMDITHPIHATNNAKYIILRKEIYT